MLIVDDIKLNRMTVKFLCKRNGLSAAVAGDGDEAVELLLNYMNERCSEKRISNAFN